MADAKVEAMRLALRGPGCGWAFVVAGRTETVAYVPDSPEDAARVVREVSALLGPPRGGGQRHDGKRWPWTWGPRGDAWIRIEPPGVTTADPAVELEDDTDLAAAAP